MYMSYLPWCIGCLCKKCDKIAVFSFMWKQQKCISNIHVFLFMQWLKTQWEKSRKNESWRRHWSLVFSKAASGPLGCNRVQSTHFRRTVAATTRAVREHRYNAWSKRRQLTCLWAWKWHSTYVLQCPCSQVLMTQPHRQGYHGKFQHSAVTLIDVQETNFKKQMWQNKATHRK